jgi:hypothetical protein
MVGRTWFRSTVHDGQYMVVGHMVEGHMVEGYMMERCMI